MLSEIAVYLRSRFAHTHGDTLRMAVLCVFGACEHLWRHLGKAVTHVLKERTLNGRVRGVQDVPVSEDCLDILRRVLVANPSQRLNMTQIRAHRWFRGSLPPGALEMNKFLINGFGPMDEVSRSLAVMCLMDACGVPARGPMTLHSAYPRSNMAIIVKQFSRSSRQSLTAVCGQSAGCLRMSSPLM